MKRAMGIMALGAFINIALDPIFMKAMGKYAIEKVFLGKDFSTKKNYSEGIASEIDKEIREIIDVAFTEAKDILTEYIEDLEKVAMALLELETINGDQFRRLVVDGITKKELVSEVLKDKKQGGPNE